MRMLAAPLALFLVALFPLPGQAEVNPDAKLFIHLVPDRGQDRPGCDSLEVTGPMDVVVHGGLDQVYYAYVLVADIDTSVAGGVAGVQFGISYNDSVGAGVDIDSWHKCAQMQWHMGDFPGANSGNLLTWSQQTHCQQTDPVVVGYFILTAHSPDRLKIIPRPVDSIAAVAACGMNQLNTKERVDNIKTENMGWVDFGPQKGYNPWDPNQNTGEMKFTPIKDLKK